MQIKRFQAQTMTEALRMVKKEFGPDAVILSAQNSKTSPGLLGRLKKPGVEVTAATDNWRETNNHAISIRLDEEAMPNSVKVSAQGGSKTGLRNLDLSGKIKRITPFKRLHGGKGGKKSGTASPRAALPSFPSGNNTGSGTEKTALADLRRQLLRQGVDEEIVSPLLHRLKKRAPIEPRRDMDGFKPHVVDILRDMGLQAGCEGCDAEGPELIVFLGPAGVGKTTTIAKLAAARALRMKQRVGVISLDNDRIGALHQSRAFARIIGVPMEVAGNGDELTAAIRRMRDREVVLIDTPGVSPLDEERLRDLKEYFDPELPFRFHLLLSAGAKDRDMAVAVERLKGFPLGGLVFTKLDESIGFGNLLNLMFQTGIPATYLTDGPDVSANLEIASLERLTDVIVTPNFLRRAIPLRPRTEKTPTGSAPAKPAPAAASPVVEAEPAPTAPRPVAREKPAATAPRPIVPAKPAPAAPTPVVDAKPAPADPDSDDNFVANKNSDIFHFPTCKWTRMIKEENIIEFKDVTAALEQNYKPCRYCKPVDPEQNAIWRRPIPKWKKVAGVG